jgi:hypothetical protein
MIMKHCRECGDKIEEDTTTCPACGKKNITDATFSFWCFLSMMGGLLGGVSVAMGILKLHALQ